MPEYFKVDTESDRIATDSSYFVPIFTIFTLRNYNAKKKNNKKTYQSKSLFNKMFK